MLHRRTVLGVARVTEGHERSRVDENHGRTGRSLPRIALHAAVRDRSGAFSASALFAYKLNWQSVLFLGYGDDRELSEEHELEKVNRQFFAKLSYAFQR